MDKITAKGLKWVTRKHGAVPYWRATEEAVNAGYRPKNVPLSGMEDNPSRLVAHCNYLQSQMELWIAEERGERAAFDGTLKTLIDRYTRDADSPYRALKAGSRRPYDHYLPKIAGGMGHIKIDDITGADLKEWHNAWSANGKYLAAAAMQRAILDAVVSYGITCRLRGCIELSEVLKRAGRKLPHPRRRDIVITADQVIAARRAAHEDGRAAWALAYAIVYETTLRLWDVIGQWVPTGDPGLSDVLDVKRGKKWFGLRVEDIDADMVLHYTPSKTEAKTGKAVSYPLSKAPMVMEEMGNAPPSGPLIVNPKTGLPPTAQQFQEGWQRDRKKAGISEKAWARDLRASGITEARAGGVAMDDAGKVAGHAGTRTTSEVYDRAVLEAADRFAEARLKGRNKPGHTPGHA